MKILVTGGAGFIGSHLVDALVEEGHEVVVLDSLDPQVHQDKPDYMNSMATYHFGRVGDLAILERVLEGVEVIFHEAAAVGVGQSMYEIERYVEANTFETAKMLDQIVNHENQVKRIVVASSMSIYGEGAYECEDCGLVYPELRSDEQMKRRIWEMQCPECGKTTKPLPTDEEKPLKPRSIYAITKRDQEEMCLSVGQAYGIPTTALRYFNVYGPRQSLSNPYTGVCAIFSSRIKNNNPPLIFEDGLQTRDFISVHDIIKANILAMKKRSGDYETFNVGTGNAISILEVAEKLTELYNSDVKPEIVNKFRAGDIRHCFADTRKIEQKLGFKPEHSFEEGMRELVAWGEKAEAEDGFEQAYEELKVKGLVEE